ncbi:hypothetical protein BCR44DRAFT_1432362 [Catenaria anguillulae PL171]|uniref:RING-type E3 ubiquitin transferase n=1 Tax=Catenaria anguillulae PL171 TaxID=765915 RepID=A0A1Y2HPY5_9FUNG|nr:hypothetical protein BCR44DRAFT_1432362 [Catenaria anguillulae PL171]
MDPQPVPDPPASPAATKAAASESPMPSRVVIAGTGNGPDHQPANSDGVIYAASTAAASDVSLTAGMLILYMIIVIASGIVVGVCLHYVFAVGLPLIKRKWQRYRTRRQLGLLLDNDPHNKFPLFQFDPAQVQGLGQPEADATAVVIQVPVAAEPDINTNNPISNTLHYRRRHHSSNIRQRFIRPPSLLRHHSASIASSISLPTSTSLAATSARPSFNRSLSATTTASLFSNVPNQLASASTSSSPPHPTTPTAVAGTSQVTCSICLDDYERGDKIRQLPCGHHFHDRCLRPWLEQSALQAPPPPQHAHPIPAPMNMQAVQEQEQSPRRRRNTMSMSGSVAAHHQPRGRSRSLSAFISASTLGRRHANAHEHEHEHAHMSVDASTGSNVHHRRWLSLRSRMHSSRSASAGGLSSSLYLSYWQRHPISCPMCRESWSLVPAPKADQEQQVVARLGGHGRRVMGQRGGGSAGGRQPVQMLADGVGGRAGSDLQAIGEHVGRDHDEDGDGDEQDDDTVLDVDAIAQQREDWMRQLRRLDESEAEAEAHSPSSVDRAVGDRVAGRAG